jgi:hypothetical protein
MPGAKKPYQIDREHRKATDEVVCGNLWRNHQWARDESHSSFAAGLSLVISMPWTYRPKNQKAN